MQKIALTLLALYLTACSPLGIYESQFPDEFPIQRPEDPPLTPIVAEPFIETEDDIYVQSLKMAAAKFHGNAKAYYDYQEKWKPGALKADIEYLKQVDEKGVEFGGGFWGTALDELHQRRQTLLLSQAQFMNGIRIVHARGTHQCWSNDAIGYSCAVENRNYTDCAEAVQKLTEENCCKWKHSDGRSILFIPGGCY